MRGDYAPPILVAPDSKLKKALAETVADAPASVAQQGLVVAGRYRLIALLGEGATSSVWIAEDARLSARVALKLLDPEIVTDRQALARFMREAKAAASLRSPHVVQVLDHGIDLKRPYIAMELLEGESLKERLRRKGTLSPAEVSVIVTHVARALTRAHDAGLVHRDIKPDNIFLVPNDDELVVKVLDFGAVKATSATAPLASHTEAGVLVGTPYYMSPEQANGDSDISYQADLWALGVVTFEMLLGVRPFQTNSLGDLIMKISLDPIPVPSRIGEVPDGFDAWFARATSRIPSSRTGSARVMADELKAILDVPGERQIPLSTTGVGRASEQGTSVSVEQQRFKKTLVSAEGEAPQEAEVKITIEPPRAPEEPTRKPDDRKWIALAVIMTTLALVLGYLLVRGMG